MIDLLDHIIDLYKQDWENLKLQHAEVKVMTSDKIQSVKSKIDAIRNPETVVIDILNLYNERPQPLYMRLLKSPSLLKLKFNKHLAKTASKPLQKTYDSTIDDDEASDTESYLQYVTVKDQLDDVCNELSKFRDSSSSNYENYQGLVGENPYKEEEYTYI
ncbi:hypothetical protein WICANDRAFT_64226 [Wickerhamomyces anomalus NRRL Y-366-8]|uniref:Uncharacterized protein n=1 Tax=Wickerhamomyces anomalus (strain ATCC 58044 / CBS 1984 / NCYC 433 / NRRL Y-366-8) TaxID=683960 RepID=A0A1E3NYK9_WICAA|nr:uncharacterized protein WICANDRAFT_64226 [Wickerhamomyces anomalus NRRL Y-366-8]ODQ58080.1 hypothetical protein WICANDRAFT_64226 [Wickerhamomyces anomalus NRRL Y-366-8]